MEYQKYYRILLPEHQYLKVFLLARLGEKRLPGPPSVTGIVSHKEFRTRFILIIV